jgi:hypothetical protein
MLMDVPEKVIYTDSSAKQSAVGAAALVLDRQHYMQRTWQAGIGLPKHWSVHAAELIVIYQWRWDGINRSLRETRKHFPQDRTFIIVGDSKSALQAVANPTRKSGQEIVQHILDLIKKLKEV